MFEGEVQKLDHWNDWYRIAEEAPFFLLTPMCTHALMYFRLCEISALSQPLLFLFSDMFYLPLIMIPFWHPAALLRELLMKRVTLGTQNLLPMLKAPIFSLQEEKEETKEWEKLPLTALKEV